MQHLSTPTSRLQQTTPPRGLTLDQDQGTQTAPVRNRNPGPNGRRAMASASDVMRAPSAADLAPLRAKWGWILALGIVYTIAGFIALGSVVMATAASVLIVGVMMIVAGVAEIINAFQCKGWGR